MSHPQPCARVIYDGCIGEQSWLWSWLLAKVTDRSQCLLRSNRTQDFRKRSYSSTSWMSSPHVTGVSSAQLFSSQNTALSIWSIRPGNRRNANCNNCHCCSIVWTTFPGIVIVYFPTAVRIKVGTWLGTSLPPCKRTRYQPATVQADSVPACHRASGASEWSKFILIELTSLWQWHVLRSTQIHSVVPIDTHW